MKKLLYIYAITAVVLTSCTDDVMDNSAFLNGKEKTPIIVETNIHANNPVSRAADGKWEANDELLAYIQHVTTTGTSPLVYATDVTGSGVGPRLAKLTVSTINNDHNDIATNYGFTDASTLGMASGETKLYWDDFSNSVDAAHDLRTDHHALRVKYGLCYNGKTGVSMTNESNGTLEWTVAANQSSTNTTDTKAFQHSDLLFSPTQTPVAYAHGSGNGITDRNPKLEIPFTHAMSKVTVVVKCDEGFSSETNNFASTSVVLQNMNTVATVTAPTATVTPVPGTDNENVKDVTMQAISEGATNTQKSFSALIVPTEFTNGKLFANINNVDNNNYTLTLSSAILDTDATNDWVSQLETNGMSKPGVHYMITVTIKKQEIKVSATIQPWENVSAEGIGVIQFANDISSTTGNIAADLQTHGFDIYQSANTSTPIYSKVTTYIYGGEPAAWTRDNEIYWPNGTDRLYFRALSNGKTGDGQALNMENGRDVLWGTTAAYTWGTGADKDVDKGAPVHPRTGDVHLEFEHPMAKITINLVDANKDATVEGWETNDSRYQDYNNPLNPRLNLAGATIQITNMAILGTIDLHDGSITPEAVVPKMLSEVTTAGNERYGFYAANDATATGDKANFLLNEYVVIPQEFKDKDAVGTEGEDGYQPAVPNNAYIIITLANGTTYRAKLNTCTDTTTHSVIDQWNRGKHYTYTITLGKDDITFRALIKDWEGVTGGGNANLDW